MSKANLKIDLTETKIDEAELERLQKEYGVSEMVSNLVRGNEVKVLVETEKYLKDKVSKNKVERIKMLNEAKSNEKVRAVLFEKCKKDPIFFFNYFMWTFNPRILDGPQSIPFVLYNFQEHFIREVVKSVTNSQDTIIEKSRDMGFSWLMVGIVLWGWLFHGWSSLLGSYKEEYVDKKGDMDSLFEKLRFCISNLPEWMVYSDVVTTFKSISSVKANCSITGDVGQFFGTGGRQTLVFLDEYAQWQFDDTAFRKTRDVTNCRIFGGTPEGKHNVYGKIMTGHPDYKDLNIKKIRLHWRLHPLKTEEWYDGEKSKRTAVEIAQELDISYDASLVGAVYPSFKDVALFGKYEYDQSLPTYTSWDFGLDMTAVIFYQKCNRTNKIYIVDAIQRSGRNLKQFYAFVLGVPTPGYVYSPEDLELIASKFGWLYSAHYGDPYNSNSRSIVSDDTIKTVLGGVGINLVTNRKSTVGERIRKTTFAIERMCIDDRLTEFINAIIQSRYPKRSEGSNQTTEGDKPVHDENSHFRTALEYAIDNEVLTKMQTAYISSGSLPQSYTVMEKFDSLNRTKKSGTRYNPITGQPL